LSGDDLNMDFGAASGTPGGGPDPAGPDGGTPPAPPPAARRHPAPPPAKRYVPDKRTLPVVQPGTAVSPNSFNAYMSEIRRFKLLAPAEETELIRRYKLDGDPEAAQKIILSNLRLVVKIARELHSYWLDNILDLVQEGNMGLMHALKKFDPAKGVKFSYYSGYWIKAHMLKYIMDNWRLVKIGTTQAQRKLFFRLKKEQEILTRQGLELLPEVIADRLGVTAQDVVDMDARLSTGREVSLDSPTGPDSNQTLVTVLPSPEEPNDLRLGDMQASSLLSEHMRRFQGALKPRDAYVFEHRLLAEEPETLQELAERFEVSRERIRQIEDKLRKNLKKYLKKALPELTEDYA
jgi:RNA polymerase sigma-32 factor